LISNSVNAQTDPIICGTITGNIPILADRNDFPTTFPERVFKVNLIVVTTTFGGLNTDGYTDVTQSDIEQMKSTLTLDYLPFNIKFRFNDCIDFYKNDDLYCKGINEADLKTKVSLDAINIWIGPKHLSLPCPIDYPYARSYQQEAVSGMSPAINAIMISHGVQVSVPNSNISVFRSLITHTHAVSHEMGHLLGLIHTFDNTNCGVHETNSYLQGDKVSDTKEEVFEIIQPFAFYSCNSTNPCNYTNIQNYSNPNNTMNTGNNRVFCANEFTNHQKGKMHDYITKNYLNYFKNCIDNPNDLIIIDRNTFWTCCEYSTDRNLYVRPGFELILQNTIMKFGVNTSVIVPNGAKIFSDHTKFTNKCTEKWDGIHIIGNKDKKQPFYGRPQTQTYSDCGIISSQNDTFEKAQIALNTNFDGIFGQWGGLILASESVFRNNWKDAAFMKYKFDDQSTFWNCDFLGGTNGVTIWNDFGIQFNDCNFLNKERYGIYSIYGTYLINRCVFENNETGVGAEADGFMYGITEMKDNHFNYNRYAGVDLKSVTLTSLRDAFKNNQDAWGIKLDGGSTSYTIDRDTFNGGIGCSLNKTASPINNRNAKALISKSNYYANVAGIHIQDDNSNSIYLCNEFKGCFIDMILDGRTSQNPASIYNNQYFNLSPDNCFGSLIKYDLMTWGNTEKFKYTYDPLNSCTKPRNTGNFDLNKGFGQQSICDFFEPKPISETRLNEINTNLNSSLTVLEKDKLNFEKRSLINALVDSLYKINDTLKITSIINNEPVSDFINEMRLKIAYRKEDYSDARHLINEVLPYTITEKKLKNLYLDKIATNYNVNNANDYNYLKSVAISDVPEKYFARSLLYFIFDERIKDPFPTFPITNEFNLRKGKSELTNEILVYPNPVDDNFQLSGLSETENYTFKLYNVNGILKKSITVSGKSNIDISDLSPGLYIIKLNHENEFIKALKFIKL
jgi:Secretion system C-terminal sorting domain/Pregnancy-associated plasma protein-A